MTSEMSHIFFLAEIWIIALSCFVAQKKKFRGLNLIHWIILLYFAASAIVHMGGVITETFMMSNLCQRMYNLDYSGGMAKYSKKDTDVTKDLNVQTKIWNPKVYDMSVDLTLGNYMYCYDFTFQNLVGKQYMAASLVELSLLKHSRINIREFNKFKGNTVLTEPKTVPQLLALEVAIGKIPEMTTTSSYISNLIKLQKERSKVMGIPTCTITKLWLDTAKRDLCLTGIEMGLSNA